jgi:hypothetical protein
MTGITAELFDLLEKSAAEADALASRLAEVEREKKAALESAAARPAPAPVLDSRLALRLAEALEQNNLLEPGVGKEAAAEHIKRNPNDVMRYAIGLLSPVDTGGLSVNAKSAAETKKNPGDPVVVEFEGRQLVDHDGWSNVLRRR